MNMETTGATRPDRLGPLRVASAFRVTEGKARHYKPGDYVSLDDIPEQSVDWLIRDGFIVPEDEYQRIAMVADELGWSTGQVVAQAQSLRAEVPPEVAAGLMSAGEPVTIHEAVETLADLNEVPTMDDLDLEPEVRPSGWETSLLHYEDPPEGVDALDGVIDDDDEGLDIGLNQEDDHGRA